ncbi:MAG: efflux RND transporter periplasmic adaptor subunit [Planctomycetota bacterium]
MSSPATQDDRPPEAEGAPRQGHEPVAPERASYARAAGPRGADWVVVLAVLLLGSAFAVLRPRSGGSQAGTAVEVVTVRRGDVVERIEAPGTVRAGSETGAGAPFEGKVVELLKDEGDPVEEGDVLFRLDPQEKAEALEEARLTHARNAAALEEAKAEALESERLLEEVAREPSDLVEAQLRERQSQLQLERTQTELQAATTRLERAKLMESQGIGTEIDVETNRDALEVAANARRIAEAELKLAQETIRFRERTWTETQASREKDLAIARRRLERAQADHASSKVALERAQRDLERCAIRSPLQGTVTARGVNLGDQITRATGDTTHYIVSDLRVLVVYLDVDEGDVVDVRAGQPATVSVSAYPHARFPGEVLDVGYRADTTTDVATFRVRVVITVPAEEHVLRPGMSARVEIETARVEDAWRIPLQSVVQREVRELPEPLRAELTDRAPEDLVDGFFAVREGKAAFVLLPPGVRDLEHAVAPPDLPQPTQVVIGPFSTLNGLEDGRRLAAKESKDFYPPEDDPPAAGEDDSGD